MVMYTFGQWIKIYRHLTMGGYPKKACPQQLLQTVNEHDKYTIIKITVICVSFSRNKVIQHCKKIKNVNGLYISYVASICAMSSILIFITLSDIKAI